MMVDLTNWVDVDPEEVGVAEKVYYPALSAILEQNEDCLLYTSVSSDPDNRIDGDTGW